MPKAKTPSKRTPTKKNKRKMKDAKNAVIITLEKELTTTQDNFKTYKKEVEQLGKKLKVVQLKQKKLKDKRIEATKKVKTNKTAATLRQLDKAKENYQLASEQAQMLKTDISAAKTNLKINKESKAKITALKKVIADFEKTWEQKKQNKAKKHIARKVKSTEQPVSNDGAVNGSDAEALVEATSTEPEQTLSEVNVEAKTEVTATEAVLDVEIE